MEVGRGGGWEEEDLQPPTVNIMVSIVSLLRAGKLQILPRVFSLLRAENFSKIVLGMVFIASCKKSENVVVSILMAS